MNEKPILFSSPMVRAILDGRKSVTRRVVKPYVQREITNTSGETSTDPVNISDVDIEYLADAWNGAGWYVTLSEYPEEGSRFLGHCPYGKPGDLLWIRETWMCGEYGRRHQSQGMVHYRADAESLGAWRPSTFMPRWASRITLRITDVRVERLQEITDNDALAEGITGVLDDGIWSYNGHVLPRDGFADLWDSINGKSCPWTDNPFVWVVSFERVKDAA